jgi:hypothetical protein
MILWVEACMTTIYVQNMSPSHFLKNITPEEAFTRVKPEIEKFRIFGCLVYFHVPKEKRSKLDPSGRKGTFVGYNEFLKAYQILFALFSSLCEQKVSAYMPSWALLGMTAVM